MKNGIYLIVFSVGFNLFPTNQESPMKNRLSCKWPARKNLALVMFLALIIPSIAPVGLLAQEPKMVQDSKVQRANYDLAARWTTQKVGKLVFDTAVTPHWLETSDRFWYTYETGQGRQFYLVDPMRKTKALMFDNAKMAAQLTTITRIPYDAQHLPIRTLKFVKKDAAFQFEVQVPRDADIPGAKKADQQTDQTTDQGEQGQGQGQQDASTGQRTPSRTRPLYFEYDLA